MMGAGEVLVAEAERRYFAEASTPLITMRSMATPAKPFFAPLRAARHELAITTSSASRLSPARLNAHI